MTVILEICTRHGVVNANPEGCCWCGRVVDELELEDGEEYREPEPRADDPERGHSLT